MSISDACHYINYVSGNSASIEINSLLYYIDFKMLFNLLIAFIIDFIYSGNIEY